MLDDVDDFIQNINIEIWGGIPNFGTNPTHHCVYVRPLSNVGSVLGQPAAASAASHPGDPDGPGHSLWSLSTGTRYKNIPGWWFENL